MWIQEENIYGLFRGSLFPPLDRALRPSSSAVSQLVKIVLETVGSVFKCVVRTAERAIIVSRSVC